MLLYFSASTHHESLLLYHSVSLNPFSFWKSLTVCSFIFLLSLSTLLCLFHSPPVSLISLPPIIIVLLSHITTGCVHLFLYRPVRLSVSLSLSGFVLPLIACLIWMMAVSVSNDSRGQTHSCSAMVSNSVFLFNSGDAWNVSFSGIHHLSAVFS